jgi:hypothetical protein
VLVKVLEVVVDPLGEDWTLALLGLLIGIGFGFFAQRSRVWRFALATAVATTQLLVLLGRFDATDSRQTSARGSLAGALAGGCAGCSDLSGAAIFTATAWVALSAIWAAAMITDRLLDLPTAAPLDQAIAGGPTAATA